MANKGKPELRAKALELRDVERKSLDEIATKLQVSIATCSRWLKGHALTKTELAARGAVGHAKLMGTKQNPETVRKRVETFRQRIEAKVWKRFRGAWAMAKQNGRTTYISEQPCKSGHVERYVSSKLCTQCCFERGRSLKYVIRRLCVCAKCRAKKDGTTFDLSPEWVQQIWPVNGLCPVMGTPFELRRGERHKGPLPMSPTLDRINPNGGYVRGNVAVLSHKANAIKQDCTDPAVFRRLADWLETRT